MSDFLGKRVTGGYWDEWSNTFWVVRESIGKEFSEDMVVSLVRTFKDSKSDQPPDDTKYPSLKAYVDAVTYSYLIDSLTRVDDVGQSHRKQINAIIKDQGGVVTSFSQ